MKNLKSVLLLSVLLICSALKAHEWKGWRGLEKQNCADSAEYPTKWSSTDNVLWKVKIDGEGYSSPVATDKHVVVTAAELDRSKSSLLNISFTLLTLLSFSIIMLSAYKLLKSQRDEVGINARKYIYYLSTFSVYGLLLFSFGVMYWMHSGERTLHTTFLYYLFSGAVVLMCILLSAIALRRTSLLRVFIGMLVILLALLLLRKRPTPEYFLLSNFFTFQSWLIPASFSSIFLPIIFSVYLISVTLYRKLYTHEIQSFKGKREFKASVLRKSSVLFLILGTTGFFCIPLISALKFFLVNATAMRIKPSLSASLFINPEFAFPFFIVVLWLFFLFWFVKDRLQTSQNTEKPGLTNLIIPCSLLLFFLLNYSKLEPEYVRTVYCLDRETGDIIWKKKCLTGPATGISNYNSQASPTPVIYGDNIFAYFGSAGLVSFGMDGKLRWENKNLPFKSPHGIGSSPILSNDNLIILNSMLVDSYITAIDPNTGSAQWRKELPSLAGYGGEYRTTLTYNVSGRDFIVEWSNVKREISLYDAKSGEIAFKYLTQWKTVGESVTTPTIKDNIIYMSDPENVVAVDLRKIIEGNDPIIWVREFNLRGPETSSPVLVRGMLFLISDNGVASCIESSTGKILWQRRLKGAFLSSPVAAGNNIYFTNNSGVTTVVACSPEFRKISENKLPEGIYATLVPVDGMLFIRSQRTLWCIK